VAKATYLPSGKMKGVSAASSKELAVSIRCVTGRAGFREATMSQTVVESTKIAAKPRSKAASRLILNEERAGG
jgi:hypothetical protein